MPPPSPFEHLDHDARVPVALSWSGGKDSALALRALLADDGRRTVALVTTVTTAYDRVAMHGVRRTLLRAQAESLGIALVEVGMPPASDNATYEAVMGAAFRELAMNGVREIAFGDLYLADVRAYRERLVGAAGLRGHYPLWGRDTALLAREFVDAGFRAVLACVDPAQIDPSFCGREYDARLLADLPASADPCGENGEFHTFVYDGPPFARPIDHAPGERVERGGFWFCDLLSPRDALADATTGPAVPA